MSNVTSLGRVQPIYKGAYASDVRYDRLDNVLNDGSTWICLQDNTINVEPSAGSSHWQLVSAKGDIGTIHNVTVSAVASDTPWGSATVSGDPAQDIAFEFGLPKGDTGDPGGFSSISASAIQIGANDPPYVLASISGPSARASLDFTFGIPGNVGGVTSVDSVGAEAGNIPLGAVRYNAVQSALTSDQKATARANINAQIADNYIVSPSNPTINYFLQYNGNGAWITSEVDNFPTGGQVGYYLRKTANKPEWAPIQALPSGGITGQYLTKISAAAGDAGWTTPEQMIPITEEEIESIIEG